MKLKDYIKKYGEYEIKDENKLKGLLEKPKPKTVWDLKCDDSYYTLNDCGFVEKHDWQNFSYDNNVRECGNCFLTEKEARFEYERRKVITEMKKLGARPFKPNLENWKIIHILPEGSHGHLVDWSGGCVDYGILCFDSLEEACNAIDTIGEERLLKYYFGVEEDEK